jgi:tetratricopeptide (TPR) repeat protein
MTPSSHIEATLQRVRATDTEPLRQSEALVEVAMDLQRQPRDPQSLIDAIFLYDAAVQLASDNPLAHARAVAGKGSALRRMPGAGADALLAAQKAFEDSLPVLRQQGDDEEVAEVEMNYGLVLQALAGAGQAQLPLAIQAYHRALRFFDAVRFPREFAILHNNLATAYLSTPMIAGKEGVREALAVQSFKEALRCVTMEEDPVEFSMLQNNLGNALQATRGRRPFESLLEAVAAYDAALRVRTAHDMPIEFANTIANKANALMNLPDDVDHPEKGNPANLVAAADLLEQAQDLFAANGLVHRAKVVADLAGELRAEVEAA